MADNLDVFHPGTFDESLMTEQETMQQSCNVCGDSLAPFFPEVRDPITGDVFAIYRCPRCGLGHTVPQPGDLGRYYAAQYYGNRHGFTAGYCIGRRLGFVKAAFPGGGRGKLLDIGCGDGSFLLGARNVGWQVAGTELNPGPARDAGLEVNGTVEEFEGDALFDCITMWHTLEHMRDIPAILAKIARLLKPEGRLIIAVPDFGGLQAGLFGPKWLHADVPRHLYHFDMGSLLYSLNAGGFSIRNTWHQEFEYDLLGWSQSALNSVQVQPNLFFDYLSGKRTSTGKPALFSAVLLGALLTLLSIPALIIGTLLKRGGTLIVVAVCADCDATRAK